MAENQNRFTRAVVRTLERTDVLENKAPTAQKQVPFMQERVSKKAMMRRMEDMNSEQLMQVSEQDRRDYIELFGLDHVAAQLKANGRPRFGGMNT